MNKCATCPKPATIHIESFNIHLCDECADKVDRRIAARQLFCDAMRRIESFIPQPQTIQPPTPMNIAESILRGTGPTNEVRKVQENSLTAEVNRLHSVINQIEDLLGSLNKRLAVVSLPDTPPPPITDAKEPCVPPPTSALAEQIRMHTNRLGQVRNFMGNMLQRLIIE